MSYFTRQGWQDIKAIIGSERATVLVPEITCFIVWLPTCFVEMHTEGSPERETAPSGLKEGFGILPS